MPRLWVGVTDYDWYRFLVARSDLDEVNFWQPSGNVAFKALSPGEIFLFKLHSPRNFIVGGGIFAHWTSVPVSLAWEAFQDRNGASSVEEMRTRIARYRSAMDDRVTDHTVGCILLEQPFFLGEDEWIPAPRDWSTNIVRGKGYDLSQGEGRRLFREMLEAHPGRLGGLPVGDPYQPQPIGETRSDHPVSVFPRLGQGSFRFVVTDMYSRRCAVTGERVLPVLQAAHIKPVAAGGPHDIRNGLLLRSDLHTLFDRGYVTVHPRDIRLEVGARLREEFENGRDYYALHGRRLASPRDPSYSPRREYLEWHANSVFRG